MRKGAERRVYCIVPEGEKVVPNASQYICPNFSKVGNWIGEKELEKKKNTNQESNKNGCDHFKGDHFAVPIVDRLLIVYTFVEVFFCVIVAKW